MARKRPRVFDAAIDKLAYKFDYNREEAAALRLRMQHHGGSVSLEDLRRIALWKLDRVLNVSEELLERLRALATEEGLSAHSPNSRKLLDDLVACKGIHFPMASAFLKFLRPDVFPIIDVRAYRALKGRHLRYHAYTTDIYLEYVEQLMSIAKETDKKLEEIDEQLYCFDKEHNGPINSS